LIDETLARNNHYRGAESGASGLRLQQQNIAINIHINIHIDLNIGDSDADLRDAGRARPDHRRLHP
jgi:hypothetical protein